ncbi:MAG: hypothetical protein OEY64_10695 [Nitrospinota bacterium]|nr:hypothetical protein [Nitrospinota bacterium]
MRRFLKGSFLAILMALPFAGFGCSEAGTTVIEQTNLYPQSSVTLTGRVIDADTREGVADAKVYYKVNGAWLSVTTSAGTTGGIPAQQKASIGAAETTAGEYKITGLPCYTTVPIVVQPTLASGLMQTNSSHSTSCGSNMYLSVEQSKQFALEAGRAVTVNLVDSISGAAVSGATVYWAGGGANGIGFEDVVATESTTTPGSYDITIPRAATNLLVTNVTDAEGVWTHETATVAFSSAGVNSTNVITKALLPIGPDTTISVVTDNIRIGGANSGGTPIAFIKADDPIEIIYNLPITVDADTLTLSYWNDFQTHTATILPAVEEITVAAAVTGSKLTVTPDAATPLTEGEQYSLEGTVHYAGTSADDKQLALSTGFHVTQSGVGTIGNTPVITIDNFNCYKPNAAGDTAVVIKAGDATVLGAAVPKIVFPELVWGTVRLISTTVGDGTDIVTTLQNDVPTAITGQWSGASWQVVDACDGSGTATVGNNNLGGNTPGAVFLLNMNTLWGTGTVSDSLAATAVKLNVGYTIGFDIYDAEGNVYQSEDYLTVQ